ncbi:tRNA/tmRNA (uracil-C(5))-methyltransferase [Folsomia candida]|uniref:tRNA/tmRNA (Uracil-C(5))-methyltransferase n=1 Tax=Folsomia candida TaxID=158441 RepID=A0A226E0G8_FOLCA|nr:tRNA/tmRNA (uracil-C(5))-methyltransferase [Folsomia candida]
MMSKAAQSVPGPSHVAGNTSHRVIAATDPTTSAISTEKMAATLEKVRHWVQIRRKSFAPNITAPISEESFRIGCYLRTLDNALDDIIYVLDDKIRRGFPIEKRGRKGVN